jgi:hypothetical protein
VRSTGAWGCRPADPGVIGGAGRRGKGGVVERRGRGGVREEGKDRHIKPVALRYAYDGEKEKHSLRIRINVNSAANK